MNWTGPHRKLRAHGVPQMRRTGICLTALIMLVFVHVSRADEIKCPDFYDNKLLSDAGDHYLLNTSIFYGWMNKEVPEDGSPSLSLHDRGHEMRKGLVDELLRPCQTDRKAENCGFKKVETGNVDGSQIVLERAVLNKLGEPMTLKGKPLRLKITLTTVDHEQTTAIPDPGDPKYDKLAERWFARARKAVEQPGIVYIWSHARIGAGPDPYPLDRSWKGKLNYVRGSWQKTNLRKILPEEKEAGVGAKVLALATCSSEEYFGDYFADYFASRPGDLLHKDGAAHFVGLTSRFFYDHEGHLAMRALIANFASGGCYKELQDTMHNPPGYSQQDAFHFIVYPDLRGSSQ